MIFCFAGESYNYSVHVQQCIWKSNKATFLDWILLCTLHTIWSIYQVFLTESLALLVLTTLSYGAWATGDGIVQIPIKNLVFFFRKRLFEFEFVDAGYFHRLGLQIYHNFEYTYHHTRITILGTFTHEDRWWVQLSKYRRLALKMQKIAFRVEDGAPSAASVSQEIENPQSELSFPCFFTSESALKWKWTVTRQP